ncbi:multidrug-efflux transporter [Chitinispirillum alkaliphilum]|nr:multidrug-efflux transporter [Chitinispirillum alkaliphilum]
MVSSRKATGVLFVSILLAMLAYGMTLPLFPFMIENLGGRGIHLGLLVALYGVMQLLFAPLWGKASDKKGRKPFILLGVSGFILAMTVFAFANSLWMLYAGQVFMGVLGSALFPVSMAYVADFSDENTRAGSLGKLGAAIGLGVVLGPGIGGLLAFDSLSLPFLAGAGLSLPVLMIIAVWLPEYKNTDLEFRAEPEKPKSGFEFLKALWGPAGFGLFIVFAVYFGKSNFSGIYGLYAMERYGYTTTEIGSLLMMMGLVYALVQGLIVGPLTKRFGEGVIITYCLLGNAVGFIFLILAYNYLMVAMSISFFIAFNAALKPSALSFISKNSSGKQGTAMGFADAYMSVGRTVGPLWAGFVFDINRNIPFIGGAVFFFLVFAASLVYNRRKNSIRAAAENI